MLKKIIVIKFSRGEKFNQYCFLDWHIYIHLHAYLIKADNIHQQKNWITNKMASQRALYNNTHEKLL